MKSMHLIVNWTILFFKQKTAYEMRISDWSSYVCSSDLLAGFQARWPAHRRRYQLARGAAPAASIHGMGGKTDLMSAALINGTSAHAELLDRKSVLKGKSVSVRVDLGGGRIIKQHKQESTVKTVATIPSSTTHVDN